MSRTHLSLDRLARAALFCAAGAGLAAAAVGWPLGGARLESALGLGGCALGLAAQALARRSAAQLCGALALAAGAWRLLPHALGLPPRPLGAALLAEALPATPPEALAALLLGTGLLLAGPGSNRRLRWLGAGVVAGSVLALGLVALGTRALGLEQSYAWGALAAMVPAAAVGWLACGAGLELLVWRANAADRQRHGLGLSAAIAMGLSASLLLAGGMLEQDGRSRRELVRSELDRLAHTLGVVTEVHGIALERMAERLSFDGGGAQALERWRADARNHLAETSAFTAFGWIEADGRAHWESGAGGERRIPAGRLSALRAEASGTGRARMLDAFPERGRAAVLVPLEAGAALLALLDVGTLTELAWGGATGEQRVSLAGADGALYARLPSGAAGARPAATEETRLPLRGLDWRLQVAAPGAVGAAPALSFFAGVSLTLLLALALALRQTALERAEALEGVSRELEASATQLLSTNAELLRSNEELGRFATLASHDLQEPLRQIISFSERLDEKYADALDEHGRTYLGFVSEAASRARVLIEDLLRYARVDGQAGRRETVDCNEALREATEQLRARIEETGAEIRSDPLPSVRGNAVLLGQLFQNLLANALKYSGGRTPRVRVGVHDAGSHWEFSVRDQGVGIHPDYHYKIFEIFERLPQEGHEEIEGTGVGLALCKKVVERHGGEIRVESSPGEGSDFRFSIPKLD